MPIGKLSSGTGAAVLFVPPSQRNFAPLTVMLAPFPSMAPQRALPDEEKTGTQVQFATALDSAGQDGGVPASGDGGSELPDGPYSAIMLGLPAPHYYQPHELSQRARILGDIDPTLGELNDFPGRGKAIMSLWINEAGGIDRAETELSNLHETLENAIVQQFLGARFRPAEREGVPVKSLMRIEVEVLPRSHIRPALSAVEN